MATSDDRTPTRTVSRDGTEIGYYTSGDGPPLLLIHGGLGDHRRWDVLRPHLEPYVTVHAMDRRGRGASGDGPDYQLDRESEDVAAVVDAIAKDAGSALDVYCSSFGGLSAFGASALTSNIGRLALYEAWPPVYPEAYAPPAGYLDRMDRALADGDREGALEIAYREHVGLTEEEFREVRGQPSWPARVAAAHTLPREERAFAGSPFDPDQAATITVPTLLLVGTETPVRRHGVETVAAALPDARIAWLDGQGHVADLLAPEVVAEPLLEFLRDR